MRLQNLWMLQRMESSLARNVLLALAIAYTIFLTLGSLAPIPQDPDAIEDIDKVFHISAYLGLAVLWLGVMRWRGTAKASITTKEILIAIVIITIYGILIEVLQGALTAERQADYQDVIANSIGMALGIGAFLLFLNKSDRLKSIF